jgi:hypothetical protein
LAGLTNKNFVIRIPLLLFESQVVPSITCFFINVVFHVVWFLYFSMDKYFGSFWFFSSTTLTLPFICYSWFYFWYSTTFKFTKFLIDPYLAIAGFKLNSIRNQRRALEEMRQNTNRRNTNWREKNLNFLSLTLKFMWVLTSNKAKIFSKHQTKLSNSEEIYVKK